MKKENEKIVPAYNHAYVEKPMVNVIGGFGFSVSAQRHDGFFEAKILGLGFRDKEKYESWKVGDVVLLTYNPFNDKVSKTVVELSNIIGRIA